MEDLFSDLQHIDTIDFHSFFLSKLQIFIRLVEFLRTKNQNHTYSREKVCRNYIQCLQHDIELASEFKPIDTEADGNCFYYSVSKILFGTDKQYKLLKLGAVFILLQYSEIFKTIILDSASTETYEKVLRVSAEDKTFANEFCILSIAILLDRPIYVFTDHAYHHNYTLNERHSRNNPLHMLHVNGNHFMPLLAKSKFSKTRSPNYNQYQKYFLNSMLDPLDMYEN